MFIFVLGTLTLFTKLYQYLFNFWKKYFDLSGKVPSQTG